MQVPLFIPSPDIAADLLEHGVWCDEHEKRYHFFHLELPDEDIWYVETSVAVVQISFFDSYIHIAENFFFPSFNAQIWRQGDPQAHVDDLDCTAYMFDEDTKKMFHDTSAHVDQHWTLCTDNIVDVLLSGVWQDPSTGATFSFKEMDVENEDLLLYCDQDEVGQVRRGLITQSYLI